MGLAAAWIPPLGCRGPQAWGRPHCLGSVRRSAPLRCKQGMQEMFKLDLASKHRDVNLVTTSCRWGDCVACCLAFCCIHNRRGLLAHVGCCVSRQPSEHGGGSSRKNMTGGGPLEEGLSTSGSRHPDPYMHENPYVVGIQAAVCLPGCMHVCPLVCLSVCWPVCAACPPAYLQVCLPACLSVRACLHFTLTTAS